MEILMVALIALIAMSSIMFIIISYLLLKSKNEKLKLRLDYIDMVQKNKRYSNNELYLEEENDNLRKKLIKYEETIKYLANENKKLIKYEETIKYLANENKKLKSNANSDIIMKAAKKAMVYSHPDKGGNPEEFIMFKDLYKTYKQF